MADEDVKKDLSTLSDSAKQSALDAGMNIKNAAGEASLASKDVPTAELGTGEAGRAPMTPGFQPGYMHNMNRPSPTPEPTPEPGG